jgi:hypothetical protein
MLFMHDESLQSRATLTHKALKRKFAHQLNEDSENAKASDIEAALLKKHKSEAAKPAFGPHMLKRSSAGAARAPLSPLAAV